MFDDPRTHSHSGSQTQKTLMIWYLHGTECSIPKTASINVHINNNGRVS